eukprot:Ihof_evm7s169 gene=Ihof_evmTU7s169
MGPVTETGTQVADAPTQPSGKGQTDDKKGGLWQGILEQALRASSKKLPQKSVLILGGRQSGKASLVARFKNNELGNVKRGMGLEYTYVDVHLEDEDQARLSLWTLDSDPAYMPLMKYALSADTLANTAVLLVVDMSRPWTIMDSLQTWAKTLQDHVASLALSEEEMEGHHQKVVRYFQEYVNRMATSDEEGTNQEVLLNLDEGVLTHNLGMPIIVVVTKCDTESQHLRDEHFDFIQMKLRLFCLKYGAALVYTTATEGKNCDVLFRYIEHRLYSLPFTTPAQVLERDNVFVPTGWDSAIKISHLADNMKLMSAEDDYEDVILRPSFKKMGVDQIVRAEDEQVFLGRMQGQLEKGGESRPLASRLPPTTSPRPSGMTSSAATRSALVRPGSSQSLTEGAASNEAVISNFFHSLIKNKRSSTQAPKAD